MARGTLAARLVVLLFRVTHQAGGAHRRHRRGLLTHVAPRCGAAGPVQFARVRPACLGVAAGAATCRRVMVGVTRRARLLQRARLGLCVARDAFQTGMTSVFESQRARPRRLPDAEDHRCGNQPRGSDLRAGVAALTLACDRRVAVMTALAVKGDAGLPEAAAPATGVARRACDRRVSRVLERLRVGRRGENGTIVPHNAFSSTRLVSGAARVHGRPGGKAEAPESGEENDCRRVKQREEMRHGGHGRGTRHHGITAGCGVNRVVNESGRAA